MSLYEIGSMTDICYTKTVLVFSRWDNGSDFSFYPLLFISVKEPVDESSFSLSSPFYLERLTRGPSDVIKVFSIEMI